MQVLEAIIHRIEKEAGTTGKATVDDRKTLLPVNKQLNTLVDGLLKVYGRTNNNYGTFDADKESFPFSEHLSKFYVTREINFRTLSLKTVNLIAAKMLTSPGATGGYSLFIRYSNQGREWLMIVMLKLKGRVGVDQDTLTLNESFSFDIDHLHEAAKVDLEKWNIGEQPYLSFIKKGNSSQQDVTLYFRNALGCTEYIDAKFNTDNLLKAVEGFCVKNKLSAEEKQSIRKSVYDYCDSCYSNQQAVNLKSASSVVDHTDPENFYNFVKAEGYEINENFSPHKSTYSRYKRITSKFGSVRLSFDVQDVIDENVDFDDENTILIKNPPAGLIESIKRARGEDID